MRIDHQTYSIQESFNLQVTLSLSLKASYDIGVTVHGIDHNASELCIVQCKYIYAMLWMLKFKVLDLIFTAIRICTYVRIFICNK